MVGTDHVYSDGTWLQMLDRLPRRSTDEEYVAMVSDNIDHTQGLQPITLLQHGDEHIIHFGGNHRICHAKFADLHSIKVNVKVYERLADPASLSPQLPLAPQPVSRWAWFSKWVDSWLPQQ